MKIIHPLKHVRFTTLTLMLQIASFALGLSTWQRWNERWQQRNDFIERAQQA
jgi:hypothetical protein